MEMNFLVGSNAKYLKYTIVLMQSIVENHPDRKINLYLVYMDGENEEISFFRKYCSAVGISLNICEMDNELFEGLRSTEFYSKEVYATLFPHLYLPGHLDRILYLDVDIIVDGNIEELYTMNLGEYYFAACAQKPDYKPVATQRPAKGKTYFNSGVILYNLTKMRERVGLNTYDYVLAHSEEFSFDQAMLNYLFYDKVCYLETTHYNFRTYICLRGKKHDFCIKEFRDGRTKIIHYTIDGQPFKSWDLYFDNGDMPVIDKKFFKKKCFYIDQEINEIIGRWWKYAIKTPIYQRLYNEMIVKREYIMRFSVNKKINDLSKKCSSLLSTFGSEYSIRAQISSMVKQGKSFLDSLNCYYGIEIGLATNYEKKHTIEQHFSENKEDYIILISGKDSCSTYFSEFLEKTKLSLDKPQYREPFIAVVEDGKVMMCSSSINVYNGKEYLITSFGFDETEETTGSTIIFNNINYSMNKRGLNIVTIKKSTRTVVDSFYIDTHKDKNLCIVR